LRQTKDSLSNQASTVVLFVPGFKGSTLVDEKHNTIWLSPKEAIFGNTSLALPIPEIGMPSAPQLKADQILKNIVVIPWVYEFNAYKLFLNSLKERLTNEAELQEFPYDWRYGSAENSKKLFSRVLEVRKSGREKIIIVGHSMGGALVSYFLRYGEAPLPSAISDWSGAKLVDGVVIAAAPFQGALSIFCDLQTGKDTAFNESLLSKDALGSFSSSYELLPNLNSILTDSDAINIFDLSFWSNNKLGLLKGQFPPALRVAREKYLQTQLLNSARFQALLFEPKADEVKLHIPLSNFIGIGFPVQSSTKLTEEDSLCGKGDFSDGDDTLTRASAILPAAFSDTFATTTKEIKGRHAEILSTEPVLDAILEMSVKKN